MRAWSRGLLVVLIAGWIAGCGIPVESAPRELPADAQVPLQPADPAPAPSPARLVEQLWFVREGVLVPVDRTSPSALDSQGLIDLLVAGPTAQEVTSGLRTAVVSVVTGAPLVVTAATAGVPVAPLADDAEVLVLQEEFLDLPFDEQLLVLGQVVDTVAVRGVRSVLFVDRNGNQLGVPLPDGRLSNGPVSPEDYDELVRGSE